MCLEKVEKVHKKPTSEEGEGWKVIRVVPDDSTRFHFQIMFCEKSYAFSRWMKCCKAEADKGKVGYSKNSYPVGFHVFLTKRAAETWVGDIAGSSTKRIVKVRYKGVLARGRQSRYKCIVANQLFVCPPEKNDDASGK